MKKVKVKSNYFATIKLMSARDNCKKLFGKRYAEKVKPYIKMIEDYKDQEAVSTLAAAIHYGSIAAKKSESIDGSLFFAAAVEMIEREERS